MEVNEENQSNKKPVPKKTKTNKPVNTKKAVETSAITEQPKTSIVKAKQPQKNTKKPQNNANNGRQPQNGKSPKLKIFSLGGLQEIGKNITGFEYGDEIIIVDCGIAFPEDEMLGIDLVTPDFSYLIKNQSKIKGLFLTHGHEDHIGSIPYLLKNFSIPIYGTNLTLGLVNNKLKEHNLKADSYIVKAGDTVNVGNFSVEFIHVNHSIADACALAITTPVGVVVHSGDFKIDYTPIKGEIIDLQRFAELGKKGVLLFMCESTNVESEGYTNSERNVGLIFKHIFETSPKERLMVATFSSNIHRIQQILNYSVSFNRKVAVMGRSMVNTMKTAKDLGYITIPDGVLIEVSEIKKYPDEQLVIITTGSQGEPMAALSRMAASEHRQVEIKPNDKIIISASPIPGNEKTVSRVINDLMKKGAEVIYEGKMDIHVSGHARQEELKLLHTLLKPKFFMPIHGEYRHLKIHKDLVVEMGMNKDNIFVLNIGDVLELDKNSAKPNGTVPSGRVLIDGLGIGDVGNIVLRDRKVLSQDGLIIVVVCIEKETGTIVLGPDIISRGFVYVRESESLIDDARTTVKDALDTVENKNDWNLIKGLIRDTLREFIWQRTKRNPMILPIIMNM